MRAGGGPVTKGKPYIVGENGPEVFVPKANGKIVPNKKGGNPPPPPPPFDPVTGQAIPNPNQPYIPVFQNTGPAPQPQVQNPDIFAQSGQSYIDAYNNGAYTPTVPYYHPAITYGSGGYGGYGGYGGNGGYSAQGQGVPNPFWDRKTINWRTV